MCYKQIYEQRVSVMSYLCFESLYSTTCIKFSIQVEIIESHGVEFTLHAQIQTFVEVANYFISQVMDNHFFWFTTDDISSYPISETGDSVDVH